MAHRGTGRDRAGIPAARGTQRPIHFGGQGQPVATSRLWRRVVGEAASAANVDVRHVYVDRFAYELGCTDVGDAVVVTEGLFGDILSDLASGRAGSIAMCASASIHPGHPVSGRCVGLFEPVHGSAPMRAGHSPLCSTGFPRPQSILRQSAERWPRSSSREWSLTTWTDRGARWSAPTSSPMAWSSRSWR